MNRKSTWIVLLLLALAVLLLVGGLALLVVLKKDKPRGEWLTVLKDEGGAIVGLKVDADGMPEEILAGLKRPKKPDAFDREELKTLAEQHRLFEKRATNPQLCYTEGAISYWSGQKRLAWEIDLEFQSRKLLLDAADKAEVKIATQGKLSYWSRRIYDALARKWDEQLAR